MATCDATKKPSGDRCGKDARKRVTFPGEEGGSARMCDGCALDTQQTAAGHGVQVKVEPLLEQQP